ncbi:GA-like domain-containing protein [Staphylococcus pseudoxylosus]|uniref:GA-like domain-containing protein n=1 Tax=Staphylococcus pseudoxylosus TaxID=2282419 RepID=UPI002DBF2B86|nr:YSIRK-type signal peptide-containing protein [Staphylococcus pseudoxylosus]MEB6036644.1 YSIRK-type signal peptide-containing protein [Staphylococcus pseudoxylosus]
MRVLAEYIARRNNKYSIRKFTIGTASVLLGTVLFMNQDSEAEADMVNDKETIEAQNNAEDQVISEIKQFDLEKNGGEHSKEAQIDENNSNVVNQTTSKSEETNKVTQEDEQPPLNNEVKAEKGEKKNEISNKVDEVTNYNFEKEQIKKQENKITEQNQTTISSHEKSSDGNMDNANSTPVKEKQSILEQKGENANQIKNNSVEEQKFVDNDEQIKPLVVTQKIESNSDTIQNTGLNIIDLNNGTKDSTNNKPKSRVTRSLNSSPYNKRFKDRRYNARLSYDAVHSGDYITTAIREVEKNRDELTEEERKLFMRNIIRQTSLKNNKSVYNNVFRGIYSVLGNRTINASQADKINELLSKMKDLTFNRDNNDYRAVYTFTNQSDVTKNHFGIVEDKIFYNDDEVLIATMVLSKEKGRGTYRFENYAIRPNASLNKKIKKVFAVYNGRQRVLLQQDHLGYYSYTRPDSGSNGNPNTGGGSGGSVEFAISFDASYYIDVKKDELFGYILSDTLDPNVLRGVNITNQSVDIDDVARRINATLVKAKKQKAEEAIQSAEQAQQYAEQQLAEVTADGAVSPAKKQKVDEAITALEEAKQIAITKLGAVLEGTAGKDDLQGRIDEIPTLTSPEVNDLDSNGIVDAVQLAEADQAVQSAEQAQRAVTQKLLEVNSDGLITPGEKAEIDRLNQVLETAMTTASVKIDNVPEGIPGKSDLQTRLAKITTVVSPEVNDRDSNGVRDDQQISEIAQALIALEATKIIDDQKLAAVLSDGLVTPSEKEEIDKLNKVLSMLKEELLEKVNELPGSMLDKAQFQQNINRITSLISPEVNDRDSNGVLDSVQLSEAERAIIAAEEAKRAVDNKLSEITADGLVNPSEKADLDRLIEVMNEAKADASTKLNNVPDGIAGKGDLQTRLEGIGTVTAPEVNDQDGNGVLDTEQLRDAEKAIELAEEAKSAVDNKLAEITADGLVNPSEKTELDRLIEALNEAKSDASTKLNNVPNGTAGKDDLQRRLDQIGSVTAPEVTDKDSNGIADTEQLSGAQQAVEAAEQAKTAVDSKVSEVTADGLVNPSEKADLDKLIEALEAAKTNAVDKLNNVPNGTAGKEDLQSRLEQIGSVTAPEINDQDGNGVLDTEQLSEAEQAIAAVEQAKTAVADKLAEITSDGLVNPTEKAELEKLIETLEVAKTNASDKLNNVPDSTAGKAGLQTRLDQISTVTAPEVNDQDSNGVLDTEQLSEAEQAIEAVEQAKQAVDNKLTEITSDGLINPTEKAELDRLIETLETAKTNATEKLTKVPNGTTGKDGLQTRLDQVDSVTSPEVNDQDSNGVLDTEQLTDAEKAIGLAEEAKRAVDNKLAEITTDGLVNPTEKAELEKLIETLEVAKTNASDKLNNVPDGTTGKDGLQTRLDQIGTVTAPEVTDKDSNGIADTAQLSEAQQAVEVAEQAKQAVDNKLAEITADGLINPSEKADLDKLIEALEEAKTNASDKLNNVPNGTTGKDELQRRLDQIVSVTAPEVNDLDSNGVADAEQLSEARRAIEAAEQAKTAANNKLAEITADGLVNPSERADLDKLIETLEAAKTTASEKLNNVPNGTTGKADLQTRLDGIGTVTSPEVNDQDGNGVLDTEQLTDAEQAIEAVEEAKQAVDNKLAEITADDLVNPSEKAELDQLIEALKTAKTNAVDKLNNVPTGTAGKGALQTRLDGIGTVTSPEVNDQDGNGVLDTEQLTDAEQAIAAVEQAKQAVDNKLTEITGDGLVNPSEKADLDQLIEALEAAKTNASEKLNNVPNGTGGKDELQTRLDVIGTVTSPEVNDQDSNGVLDTEQLTDAEKAIEAVEQAKQAVDNKLTEITADGLVNPSEKAELDKLIEALEAAKTNAVDKLNNVPNGTAGKEDLQSRLDQIGSVTAPEINDQDGNGVLDTEQLSEAQQAIEAAEQAKTAADNKLSEITEDGLVNPSERADLDKLIETLETSKTNASEKLNNVPDGTTGKNNLQGRLDQIGSVTAPAITDADSNGVADTEQLAQAQQAVEAAEQAKTAVDNKLSEVTADGLVNPSEKADLDKLIEALEAAKTNASEKLNNVPDGTTGKDVLQTRLDQVDSVTAPEINDQDGNGVLDTEQLTEAEKAIEAVEEAKQAVDNKLSEITEDGLINPSEKADLDKLIETLEAAKATASEKLNNVPDSTAGKEDLQRRLVQIGSVVAPAITDADSNGVADTEQLSEAQRAIEAAEQAKQAVDNKLAEITADGLVNPSEKADLDKLIEALEAAKTNASDKMNNVPNGTAGKVDLQTRLDQIGSVTAPEVNDLDSNGVLDDEQLSEAQQAIEAAEQAKQAVDNKLTEITADGLVNPSEKAELDKLIETLETAKTNASEKLNNVPNGTTGKAELQTRLDQVDSVTAPEINDQDGNGVLDTEQLTDAEQSITAVEQAKSAVDNKLTEITADGLVNPNEKADLDKLIEALEAAKTNASEKLNNVPDGTTGKADLQTRLDQIGTVTSPEVNDQDDNGVLDTEQLTDAEQAIEAVEQAKQAVDNKLSEITADDLINPTEKAELDRLIETLETAKTNATEKLNNVPGGTAGKDDLQSRLDQIGSVTAPEVTDKDSNGIADTEQLSEAQQAVEAAEQAKTAVDNKLSEVTADGLVNPSEKAELDKLIETLEAAKTNASEKLNNVPDGTTGKDGLQTRLDGIGTVTSPEVNDQDDNGVLDTEQLSEAEQAIEAVEQAKQAVDNKLTEITADGLINPTEKAELDRLIETLETAKTNATEKLTKVPDGTTGKADLQTRLDQIGSVTAPEVNDLDSNGVLDAEQLSEAQQAIEAAEQAKQVVDNKLTEITADGLVNPSEKAELDKLIETLEEAKTNASEKLNNVPDSTAGKAGLQTRLDRIGTVTSPEVNDRDSNGVLDIEQLSEAEKAIELAEEAKSAVDNKLTEITADGLVNPTEKTELDRLIETLETAKTNATEKLTNVPDGTTGKADLQTRLDVIGTVTSSEVNDQDGNGVLDTEQLSDAEKAIEAVEEAKQTVDNKLTEITADGLVNPSEKADLDKLIEALEAAKTNASEKLNNVPNGTTGKAELQRRLDQVDSVTAPEINDQDGNGVLDTEQLSDAEKAIEAVEQAKQAVDNKLSEITADDLINPTEKAELGGLIETLETAKTNATEKLNNVPDGTAGKADLQTRLDQVDSVTAPEINDQDGNGVLDTEQLSEAQQAIEAAEQAKIAADNKLAEITGDGLVNPSEKADLDKLIETLEAAKTNATEKLNNVPDGTTGKDGLQTRLDGIGTVTSPEVNDQDDNGVLDTEQLTDAEQAIEAVEQAKQAVDNKLTEITADGLINPSEKAELDQLIEALETAKTNASEKLNNVPDGTTGKDGLQTRLDQIGTVTSPEVNDQDGNGFLDTEQLTDAEQAIEAVEEAKQAVDNKLTEITADGLINPSEKVELEKLIEVLETAKTNASDKLNNVPNGTAGKDELQRRLDQIGSVTAPEVTDKDSNGVLDTEQLTDAEKAIEALEEAKSAVDNKLTEITADGLVNPNEKADLDKLIEVLEAAKTNASEKLNNVPDGTTGKADLQTRLDQVDSVTAPEVNDLDSNGVLDAEQLSEAQQAIEAAEEAKSAVDNKLSEITEDGLINPSEKAELDQLIEALETAKTTASEKLNNVPDGTTGKDRLQTRLDGVGTVTAPEVNDQDGNGVLDTEQLSEAEQAIAAVEQAKQAVDNKLAEITADGLINPSEKAELEKLIEVLETAKTNATDKLNNVPNGTAGKDDLQTRLDQVDSVTAPEINDQDSNGVLDTEQLSDAEQAIEAVEQAKQAVDNKLTEITSDGLINPSEKAELDRLIETLETAKTNATDKLNNVPNGTAGKDDLQSRLDQIGSVTAPEVTDKDSNGIADTEQLSEAQQAVEAAEQAKTAVDNKLSEVTADGLVNPSEKADLDKLIETLEAAKTNASEKLNNVPNGTTGKDGLQTRLDQVDSVTSPEVNDQDGNGVLDTEQLTEAEQAIAAVEQAKQAVDNKLAEITADGLVNPSEKADLDKLIEALEAAKTNTSEKLNNVPDSTTGKDVLQTRLDQVDSVTSPEVNDQDGNGVADTEQLSEAQRAIEAAEQAKTAVDNKLAEITADGLVNPSEKADLDRLIEALDEAKVDATAKLNSVPVRTPGKSDIQTRLDGIGTVTTPEVNDQDSNGVLDAEQLAKANKAIQAVEQAKAKVEGKLTEIKKDGLINPSEKAEVDKLIEALQKAKVSALNIIKKLPNSDIDINSLQNKLEQITLVTSPKVNDQDGNGILDIESPNTKGQNHANVNKHLDNTIRKSKSQKPMNNNVKIQNSNERDNMLLDEIPHTGLYRHNSEARQLNVISSYIQIMENEANGNSENNMNSITYLPDTGGKNKDSWIFGTLLGAIGSMMLLRKKQEKRKEQKK